MHDASKLNQPISPLLFIIIIQTISINFLLVSRMLNVLYFWFLFMAVAAARPKMSHNDHEKKGRESRRNEHDEFSKKFSREITLEAASSKSLSQFSKTLISRCRKPEYFFPLVGLKWSEIKRKAKQKQKNYDFRSQIWFTRYTWPK